MPTKTKILSKIASKAGWQGGLITKGQKIKPTNDKLAFIKVIAENSFNENSLDVDAIYFNDISPIIYIKEISSINPTEINQLQNKFWNESRTPLSLIITPVKIYLLSNFTSTATTKKDLSKTIINEFTTDEEALNKLALILHQSNLDTDNFFIGENKLKYNTEDRVDKKLITQLHEARKILFANKKYNLTIGTIHNLLGRSLFTFYLEHRGILTKKEIGTITGVEKTFANLLTENPTETYSLFEFLKVKFNGDLFPVNQEEENAKNKYSEILKIVSDCFTGLQMLNANGNTGQGSFFPLFNFKFIPIELISAIYEEFMSNEEEKNGKIVLTEKQKDGAFYTPQMLVEFTYNEVLPMPTVNDYSSDFKILDPTCGSGIFLVEGFKRLIERWKYANPNKNITPTVLNHLLYNNIFGIEKNPEATKVTAFSLYLTFLNYMNPRKVLDEVRFKNLIHWTDEEEVNHRKQNNIEFGKNILQASTFIRETTNFKSNPSKEVNAFFNTSFNLIIGNPPWKRSNVEQEIKQWAKQNNWNVNKDIIKAFIAYTPAINPTAKVALIVSAKSLLFNTEIPDIAFRQKLFTDYKISTIVNFSVVRQVVFENAKKAGALIIYENRNNVAPASNETILYCVPQKTEIIKNRKSIVIDETEIKFLPVNELEKANSKLFKIAMFGGLRDLKFLCKLEQNGVINNFTELQGGGLNKDKDATSKGNPQLKGHFFIPTDDIQQFYTVNKFSTFGSLVDNESYRTDTKDIYTAPLILFKEGTKNSNICCSYIDYNIAFLTKGKSIRFSNKSIAFHKALVACLNSEIATFFFISTTASWGVEIGLIQKNEMSLFPMFINKFYKETINTLASFIDQIIEIKKQEISDKDLENLSIVSIKKQIDKLIYKELKISKYERALIDNVINYSNVIKNNYKSVKAENKTDEIFINQYATAYADIVNNYFKHSAYKLKIETFTKSLNSSLIIIKCTINKRDTEIVNENNADIISILDEINKHTYQQYTNSIYFRKTIEYYIDKNTFYFIKPNQRKFWNIAQALNDADALIVKLLNQHGN
jgi:hypothetical protein